MYNYNRNELTEMTVKDLKAICKENEYTGYSKLNKSDLIDHIMNNQPNYFDNEVTYTSSNNNETYSILFINPSLSIEAATKAIKETVNDQAFQVQTSSKKEVKALYKAGFRHYDNEYQTALTLNQTIEKLQEVSSINMQANTGNYNIVAYEETDDTKEYKGNPVAYYPVTMDSVLYIDKINHDIHDTVNYTYVSDNKIEEEGESIIFHGYDEALNDYLNDLNIDEVGEMLDNEIPFFFAGDNISVPFNECIRYGTAWTSNYKEVV